MPDPPEVNEMYFGEHFWAPACLQRESYGEGGWTQPDHDCPVKLRQVAVEYIKESSGSDCSLDERYTLRLPAADLMMNLGLRWTGRGAEFENSLGQIVAQDPTAFAPGPSALLLRADVLLELQQREHLTLCWAVVGEKRILNAGFRGAPHPELRVSGAYILERDKLTGFVKRMLDERDGGATEPRLIDIHRS